jgi:hypothetical protein
MEYAGLARHGASRPGEDTGLAEPARPKWAGGAGMPARAEGSAGPAGGGAAQPGKDDAGPAGTLERRNRRPAGAGRGGEGPAGLTSPGPSRDAGLGLIFWPDCYIPAQGVFNPARTIIIRPRLLFACSSIFLHI